MQQAYRAIRVVAEAQTVRIALAAVPDALMLRELISACAAFGAESSSEVKAVILDTGALVGEVSGQQEQPAPDVIAQAEAAVRAVAPPLLAVARGALSAAATNLVLASDLIVVEETASLTLPQTGAENASSVNETITANEAMQKHLVTLLASARALGGEVERVLDALRDKSALALRLAKASVNLAASESEEQRDAATARLAALQQINELYLERVAPSADANEGLRAFLEKRKPQWKNL